MKTLLSPSTVLVYKVSEKIEVELKVGDSIFLKEAEYWTGIKQDELFEKYSIMYNLLGMTKGPFEINYICKDRKSVHIINGYGSEIVVDISRFVVYEPPKFIFVFDEAANEEIMIQTGKILMLKPPCYRQGMTKAFNKEAFKKSLKILGSMWGPFKLVKIFHEGIVQIKHIRTGEKFKINKSELMTYVKGWLFYINKKERRIYFILCSFSFYFLDFFILLYILSI